MGQFFYYFQTKSKMMHSRSVVAHICTKRCRIAEKYLHFICISLNNKSVHCIIPHSLKNNFLIFCNPTPHSIHSATDCEFDPFLSTSFQLVLSLKPLGRGGGCRKLEFFLVSCYLFTGYSNYYM